MNESKDCTNWLRFKTHLTTTLFLSASNFVPFSFPPKLHVMGISEANAIINSSFQMVNNWMMWSKSFCDWSNHFLQNLTTSKTLFLGLLQPWFQREFWPLPAIRSLCVDGMSDSTLYVAVYHLVLLLKGSHFLHTLCLESSLGFVSILRISFFLVSRANVLEGRWNTIEWDGSNAVLWSCWRESRTVLDESCDTAMRGGRVRGR